MEHFSRRHLLRQLHHAAVRAKCHLKFKEILIRKLSRAKKAIRNRHPTEGHEWFNQSITYQAFIHDFLTLSLQKKVINKVADGIMRKDLTTAKRTEY